MSEFLINSYTFPLPPLTEICNHTTTDTNMSSSSGNVRCTKIDVSSLSSPITVGELGYYGGGSIAGELALGLYSDDSGAPDSLLCQTASTAAASGAQSIETIATASVTHSGLLWIGFITKPTPSAPVDYPRGVDASGYAVTSNQAFTYPDFPSTYSVQGEIDDRCKLCLSYR